MFTYPDYACNCRTISTYQWHCNTKRVDDDLKCLHTHTSHGNTQPHTETSQAGCANANITWHDIHPMIICHTGIRKHITWHVQMIICHTGTRKTHHLAHPPSDHIPWRNCRTYQWHCNTKRVEDDLKCLHTHTTVNGSTQTHSETSQASCANTSTSRGTSK